MTPTFRPTSALADDIRRGTVGSLELLDHYLGRIECLNPGLNAVVILDVERARARARAADEARTRGESWGPLHGVPFTIKDSFETAGLRTTCGWRETEHHVPAEDAVAVARLRAAGAVIFGKTNVPTLASDVQSYNPIFGTTNNPWDPARTPGGSSGGAATAVAAGLTGGDIGSDIGGSIRTPSSWCGIFGHKATYGIIPGRGHIPGPPGTLSEVDLGVFGPLGRSAEDLDLLLGLMVGPSDADAIAWRLTLPPPRHEALRSYRMAAWFDDPLAPVDAGVRGVLERAATALRGAGVVVDDAARPVMDFADLSATYRKMLYPIVLSGMPDDAFENLVKLGDAVPAGDTSALSESMRAIGLRYRDWILLHERRTRTKAAFADFFRTTDVLLMPVVPVAAIPHDHSDPIQERTITVNGGARPYTDLFHWIAPATYAHLPATAVPIGRTPDGLPVGLQIVGPHLEDRTTIDVARRIAEVVGGYASPPNAA